VIDGNVSEPVVSGSTSLTQSDVVAEMQTFVAGPDTEEAAEAELIRPAKREQVVAKQTEVPESIEEPADATTQQDAAPEPPGDELTPEQAVAEVRKLREEAKKLQAAKDRQYASYQAEQYKAQQEREQLLNQQQVYKKQMAQWQAQQDAIAEQARESQRRAEAEALEREVAAQPPEVQAAYRVAMRFIEQNKEREAQEGHDNAVRKMNSMLMQGIPGEAFQGLPEDRPLTPQMVDYAAARYMDWRYMQESATRVKPTELLKAIAEKRKNGRSASPPPVPVAPPTPPPAKPVSAQRVTPGTGGRVPSNTQAQFNAAISNGDFVAAEKYRRQLGIEYKEQRSD
jgi:hypothetical protein